MTERPSTTPPTLRDGWLARPLVEAGVLSPTQVHEAEGDGAGSLWEVAVRRGWARSEGIVAALAAAHRVPVAELASADPRLTPILPETVARKYRVVPLAADSGAITLATADPRDLAAEQELRFLTGREVAFAVASPEGIAARLDELYRPEASV
ncbi:MAG TPA: hypothetical protein VFI13_05135, partial [Gemmatimonadales bacterium]|nr:hypothetical protein [Gemmatimonadales bacterium]